LTAQQKAKYWPISPNAAIEIKSETDDFAETVSRVEAFVERGSQYAVAINPMTREVEPRGILPPNLEIDFDAIIDG
jgi:hypothetical protein